MDPPDDDDNGMDTTTGGDAAAAAARDEEPNWASHLRKKRLRGLYEFGPVDAFITAVERIARRCPAWHGTSHATTHHDDY